MLSIDTTYFKRRLGLMVFRDVLKKQNIFWRFVDYETIALYQEGIETIQSQGFEILGITTDGRRGIFKAFGDIPVQMCHFHQKQIVKRYITSNPKLEAGIELKEIVSKLTITDEALFEYWLTEWFNKWSTFLKEKTLDPKTRRKHYTHRRLRSAYNSLKSNLPYLYTYLKHLSTGMPNTTNSLDGFFSQLKKKVNIHNGLRFDRKIKLIQYLLD